MKLSRLLFIDFEAIGDWAMGLVEMIFGMILYNLCIPFFWLINLCETLYRKFAGLEVVYDNGTPIEGDIVVYLVQSDIVQNVFISILILGLFLLIIFTILAIVKNQYADKPKPVSGIISNSFKGLLLFWVVPIACIVGLAVGNVVLRMVDEATSTQVSGESNSAGMLFIAGAYSANELRDSDGDTDDQVDKLIEIYESHDTLFVSIGINSEGDCTADKLSKAADIVDNAFVSGEIGHSIYNFTSVYYYYDMFQINYLSIWVGGAFLCYCLVIITWGLLGRIFKVVILYAFSPAVLAVYPHDEGKAFKDWRGEFIKNATMGYTSVAVLNIFYSVLPVINRFDFFYVDGLTNAFIRLLITISAFMMVKDFLGTVANWFGTGDAYKAGADVKKGVTDKLKKGVSKVSGAFQGLRDGRRYAKEHGGNGFMGALTGAMGGAGVKNPLTEFQANRKKVKEAAEKAYKDQVTTIGGKQRTKAAADRIATFDDAITNKKEIDELLGEYNKQSAIANSSTAGDEEKDIAKKQMEIIAGKIRDKSAFVKHETEEKAAAIEVKEKRAEKGLERSSAIDELTQTMTDIETLADRLGLKVDEITTGSPLAQNQGIYDKHIAEISAYMNRFNQQRNRISKLSAADKGMEQLIAQNSNVKSVVERGAFDDYAVEAVKREIEGIITAANDAVEAVKEEKKSLNRSILSAAKTQQLALEETESHPLSKKKRDAAKRSNEAIKAAKDALETASKEISKDLKGK